MGYNEKTSTALSSFPPPPPPSGQLFSDWLGWLCNDWDGRGKQARFEATMDIVARELSAAGVSGIQRGGRLLSYRLFHTYIGFRTHSPG